MEYRGPSRDESMKVTTSILTVDYSKFKIRLFHDELKIFEFFGKLVRLYVEQDPDMIKIVDKIKTQIASRKRRINKAKKAGRESLRKFGIDKEEIENIFDVLAQEFPDL